MVQSDEILPIPTRDELQYDQATGYLWLALHKGLNNGISHLNTCGLLKTHYAQA